MYRRLGGYANPRLRATVLDDRDLAAEVKRAGGRLELVDGRDLVAALAAVLRIDPRPASSCKRRSLASDRPGPRPSVPSWAMSPAALAWSR